MLALIVNADDLGLTPGCNQGIVAAMVNGIVTDTTLMINTGFTDDALLLLKKHGISRVGLHLNLTFGQPVMPQAAVRSLVNNAGFFYRKMDDLLANLDINEAEKEYRAQISKFMDTGLGLTHLDSHHHAHSYPQLLELVMFLAQELKIPLRHTNCKTRKKIRDRNIVTPDYFSADFYDQGVSQQNLLAILSYYKDGVLEIMCHPAVADPVLFAVSSYTSCRERELELLTAKDVKNFIKEHRIELINYDALRVKYA